MTPVVVMELAAVLEKEVAVVDTDEAKVDAVDAIDVAEVVIEVAAVVADWVVDWAVVDATGDGAPLVVEVEGAGLVEFTQSMSTKVSLMTTFEGTVEAKFPLAVPITPTMMGLPRLPLTQAVPLPWSAFWKITTERPIISPKRSELVLLRRNHANPVVES